MRLYDNDEYREEFMAIVYGLLMSDSTNDRANQIISAFDCAPEVEAEPVQPNDPLTLEELREMDGIPVWIDNGYGRNKCYIVNNRYEIHGDVGPCGVDLWGTGTSLSLLVRCGVYRRPPNKEERV